MYVLKGFISNTRWANNTPGVVSQLGELSPIGITFSREKGYYSDKDIAQNLLLTTFISNNNGVNRAVPVPISSQILEVANYVYNQTLSGQVDIDPTLMLENLLTNYAGKAENFECGAVISDGAHALPEWVSWKTKLDATLTDNFIKIWFVDQSFQQQYDEYEIVVIPPTSTLDNFFQSGDKVETMLLAFSSEEKIQRIQIARAGYPETIIRMNTFVYIDPLNRNHQVPSDWGLLIYGPAGDNVDAIKDALMDYIIGNSVHTRADWTNILPDIFKRTEFIMLPLWDHYAIPNRVLETGIYSPQVRLATAVSEMKQFATQYPTAHIDSHVSVLGHPYRSLSIVSIGSPDNRNSQFELADVFPDFISVSSTSPDFNRMSAVTQGWASMIAEMLVVAEKMGEFTTIPAGFMKVKRGNVLYLTRSYKNINYLIVAKVNITNEAP